MPLTSKEIDRIAEKAAQKTIAKIEDMLRGGAKIHMADEWLTAGEVRRITGLSRYQLQYQARKGTFVRRKNPETGRHSYLYESIPAHLLIHANKPTP